MQPRRADARPRVRIGRYALLGRMGRGGMGTVYRARDEALDREIALKTLNAQGSDADSRRRFEVEAKAAARLAHPNIVTVYELGEDRGVPFIAMEMLAGVDLEALLRQGPPLALAEKLDVMVQVLRGLAYAHERGIVHRDVKPSNVRLLEDGTAKLMDFGIAKLGATHLTKTGMMVGTINYMSPEQVRGRTLDGRSDVFSAGVILYEMLAGQRPFRGEGPTQVLYRIVHDEPAPLDADALAPAGDRLRAVVARALAKDPAARFASAGAMADELAAFLDELAGAGGRDARAALRQAVATRVAADPRPAPEADDGFPEVEATFAASSTRHEEPARTGRTGVATEVAPTVVEAATAMVEGQARSTSPPAAPRAAAAPPAPAPRTWLWVGAVLAAVVVAGALVLLRRSPPPASRGEGRLLVRSQPVGAAVLVDGRDTGVVTNGEIVLPSGGAREAQITFRKPGHRDETRAVRVPPAPGESVSVTLEASARSVRVTTEPAGATVTVDGQRVAGTTPLEVVLDGAREHRVGVALEGHAPREVAVAAGEPPVSLDLALEKAAPAAPAGSVLVRSSYAVEVSWHGRTLARGEANPRVSLPGGRQVLTLSAPAVFLRAEVAVEVLPRGEAVVDAPALGRLNVRAQPDNCEVFVGGAFVDYPPILDRPAAAGRHVVAFKWPDGARREETVEVRAGAPAFVVGRKE